MLTYVRMSLLLAITLIFPSAALAQYVPSPSQAAIGASPASSSSAPVNPTPTPTNAPPPPPFVPPASAAPASSTITSTTPAANATSTASSSGIWNFSINELFTLRNSLLTEIAKLEAELAPQKTP